VVRILKWQGPQQDAFYQRKDRSGRPKAESKRENDCQTKGRRLAQAADREREIPWEGEHTSPWKAIEMPQSRNSKYIAFNHSGQETKPTPSICAAQCPEADRLTAP
jgi:hypothetical protein